MDALIQDLRHAFRQLRRSPGFTLAAVLTLALGIGPNTAIFSMIYGLMLRPLPYAAADRLVGATWLFSDPGGVDAVTSSQYAFWREHNRVFSGTAAFGGEGAGYNLDAAGEPEYIRGRPVSAELFDVLGVAPVVGRPFSVDEDKPGGPPVVILSHSLWQRRFAGATDVIGRTLPLNGGAVTIVGVMPRHLAATAPPGQPARPGS
jgi:putative ABC transport system permease protein